jgi:hypothetical protein
MEKLFEINVTSWFDDYDNCPESQKVEWDDGVRNGSYYVHNLCECPEDACIGRDLFSADDFIAAIAFGMRLAQDGYTGIHTVYEEKVIGKEEDE